MKYINWEKIKDVTKSSGFALVTTVVIGVSITAVGLYEYSQVQEVNQYIESVEYVCEEQQFLLNELYVVEKDDMKYLCSRAKIDRIGMEIYEKILFEKHTGRFVPGTARNIYEYRDIKTNELICVSGDDNVIIYELVHELAKDVNEGVIEKEEINQEYIDNHFKNNVK